MTAEVFQVPRQPDGKSYYNSPNHTTTPASTGLRRSTPSSSSLFLDTSSSSSLGAITRTASFPAHTAKFKEHQPLRPPSPPPSSSSTSSSPSPSTVDLSSFSHWRSSPNDSGLSLDSRLGADDLEDIDFPQYDSVPFPQRGRNPTPPGSDAPEPSITTGTTQSNSPVVTPSVFDDTAVQQEPSRHVDYLSHDWREEDIWASWRHIVSQRKVYGQRSRLENASWRTWAKSKYSLRTVPPEKLNWLKESDVTWLYGPLKPANTHPITDDTSEPMSQISKNSSFINKKPILKKRSMSEAMLQKSLSSSSLLKQAAASVQAQQTYPVTSPYSFGSPTPLGAPSQPPSRDQLDYFSSRTNSVETDTTPGDSQPEKHIRFDEKVEQCIAVEVKEGEISDEENDSDDDSHPYGLSESSSDEGLVMMKSNTRRRPAGRRKADKGGHSQCNPPQPRMIEEIEATTLKSRTDSPEVTGDAQHHVFGGANWTSSSRILSPSPSQETLRPSRPSRNFLLADDGEDEEDDSGGSSWSFGASNPKSSLGAATSPIASPIGGQGGELGYMDGYDGIEGMRRTESGMFMPYDEDDEDAIVATGLFGRVSETFNTMRDIGHVLYTAFRT